MTERFVLGSMLEDLLELYLSELSNHLLVVVETSLIQLVDQFALFHGCLLSWVIQDFGANGGNRTLVLSLEGFSSAIELRSHILI